MGGDDSICSSVVELAQDGLGDGSARRRFGSRTELVDKDECLAVRLRQHVLHVVKERAVGTQVVVDGLVVSDVDHYAVEDHEFRRLRCRNEHAPLEHVLEQADCLEADRFSSCVRT